MPLTVACLHTNSNVRIQVGAAPLGVDPGDKEKPSAVTENTALQCVFRIANESFSTDR